MSASSAAFVSRVEQRMAAALSVQEAGRPDPVREGTRLLADASSHLCGGNGAKRFRPQLVHLLGELFGLSEEVRLRIAVSAELIHAASLLHDDVIDAGTERRGRPTANVQWGNSVAVLAGDWLLTQAILEVAPLGPETLRESIETVAAMTSAAVREVEARGRTDLSLGSWRSIAEGKAGELFAWCARSLALLGDKREAAQTLTELGRRLGVAFQMADDLKDIVDLHSGKDRFADLHNRNPSFALVVAMEREPQLRERIARSWARQGSGSSETDEIAALGQQLAESGALKVAEDLLREEVRTTLALLRSVAPPRTVDDFIQLAAAFAGPQATLLRGAA